jgi:flagellar protein FlbD
MLAVTRFNGTEIMLNPELVLYVESIPDTIVTMTTGEKIYIKERSAEVQRRFMEYKQKIFSEVINGELKVKGD